MLGVQPTGVPTAQVQVGWLGLKVGSRLPLGAALHSSDEPSELTQ